jgi:Tfp pilus assembly protein PilV
MPALQAVLQEKLMLRLICNKKGISLIEVMVAIVLTAIGLVTLSSLQDSGWKATAKADYVGRASGILYSRLEFYEAWIANPCRSDFAEGTQAEQTIQTSGSGTAIRGDIAYTINANIRRIHTTPDSFRVTVTVTWTGNTRGISESLEITRQQAYKFGC